ncbi:MAG: DUF4870 domain-containing protein [Cytophagales bacterium]|nr:DUF4870 domain-containing protein [Cytophagales bacterium]
MTSTPKYLPVPQPDEIPEREKEDAMGAYLMMFAAIAAGLPLPIINLIAAIIYYFINRSKSLFVHFHSLQSLYSQFPTSILNIGAVFWAIRIYFFQSVELTDLFWGYIGMVFIANLIYFIFSIVACVQARKGRMYYFIFFGKIAFHQVFLDKGTTQKEIVNLPPGSVGNRQ